MRRAGVIRGRLLAVGIILLAVGATWFNFHYQRQKVRRALAFWGEEAAAVIVLGPRVEAMRFSAATERAATEEAAAETRLVRGRRLIVAARCDATDRPGMRNLRRGLVQDASFAWDEPPHEPPPEWGYALRFVDGESTITVLFSTDTQWAGLANTAETVSVRPVAEAIGEIFDGVFAAAAGEEASEGDR